jgi:hypothetical protein
MRLIIYLLIFRFLYLSVTGAPGRDGLNGSPGVPGHRGPVGFRGTPGSKNA